MTTVGAASSRDWVLIISNAYRGWKPLLRLDIRIARVFTQPRPEADLTEAKLRTLGV